MKLTIGMATYGDLTGVYFTIQSLRLHQNLEDAEILVVDNKGDVELERWVKSWGHGGVRYERFTEVPGTTQARQKVFELAKGECVICVDSHVLLARGALDRLWDGEDLVHGPMIYDDCKTYVTHMEPVWRASMWGVWGKGTKKLPEEPFEIPMHGLGLFGCRRESWLGFNSEFRGFGGEEGYIHEKFRKAGRKVICLPWMKWLHQFEAPKEYPLDLKDRVRNYLIGFRELGLDWEPIFEHFGHQMVGRIAEELGEGKKEVKRILLVANGPGALDQEGGEKIDAFEGWVCRFNWYETEGWEKYVGTRTDVWVTIDSYAALIRRSYKKVYHHAWREDETPTPALGLIQEFNPSADFIPLKAVEEAKEAMGGTPSTGAIAAWFFLRQGYEVWIYGFDFLDPSRKHHYMHDEERGAYLKGTLHKHEFEKPFFEKLIRAGKVKVLK